LGGCRKATIQFLMAGSPDARIAKRQAEADGAGPEQYKAQAKRLELSRQAAQNR
jgi:hypothetical protein